MFFLLPDFGRLYQVFDWLRSNVQRFVIRRIVFIDVFGLLNYIFVLLFLIKNENESRDTLYEMKVIDAIE